MTKKNLAAILLTSLTALTLGACATDSDKTDSGDSAPGSKLGRLSAALTVPQDAKHDVAMAQFNVVAIDGDCSDAPLATTTTAIEDEALVASLDYALEEGYRAFADGLMTLPPGEYKVCVQPLKADGSPSDECAVAEGTGTVFEELTTEIVLVSQCDGISNGALDVVVSFNDPPLITEIKIEASKFITTCETATISIAAEDPNKDELSYSWEQVSGPMTGSLMGTGPGATFTPNDAGDYEFKVTVTDSTGANTSLIFPIHVSAADGACQTPCPEGTVDAAGFCWVAGEQYQSARASCAAVGLTGSSTQVEGVEWTEEMMEEVTLAWGCTNAGKQGCCQSGLYIDPETNECTTQGFHEDNGQFFTNGRTVPGFGTALHLCQRPE